MRVAVPVARRIPAVRAPVAAAVRAAVVAAVLAVVLAAGAAAPASAQLTLVEGDGASVTVGGYVRSITGLHDYGFDPPAVPGEEALERESGFHSEVVRVKWRVEGRGWRIEAHDRLQARVVSQGGATQVLGFGVSAVPDRLVDLRSDLVERDRLAVWHDLDRLSLTVLTDLADVTVGRQAITWGTAAIFPVADLWAQFSPFELDTEEKPGIDAVRVLSYPVDRLELDGVVAHRGAAEDLSAGLRATYSLPSVDLWVGGGKFWREAIAMGGATVLLDAVRLRGEVALPYDLDGGGARDPRATAGADWIRGTLTMTGEYHFNGIGSDDADGYALVVTGDAFQRGETYYLGRHYLGGAGAWSPDAENRLNLALNALVNLGDGSAALTPLVTYDLGQATRIAVGGLLSFGDTPGFTPFPPTLGLRSEFGAYGDMVFTTVSVYF